MDCRLRLSVDLIQQIPGGGVNEVYQIKLAAHREGRRRRNEVVLSGARGRRNKISVLGICYISVLLGGKEVGVICAVISRVGLHPVSLISLFHHQYKQKAL